jgi:hypothetical protein
MPTEAYFPISSDPTPAKFPLLCLRGGGGKALLIPIALLFAMFLADTDCVAQKEAENCNFGETVNVSCNGFSVDFNGSAVFPNHQWNFGDGTTANTGPSTIHLYDEVNPFIETGGAPITVTHSVDGGTTTCQKTVPFPGIAIIPGCSAAKSVQTCIQQGLLPAGGLTGKNLYIFGTLDVDIPYSFENCNIFVLRSSRIRVPNGGALTLKSCTVDAISDNLTLCSGLWMGFELERGGKLTCEQSVIQNMYFGIDVSDQVASVVAKPEISLIGNTFKRFFVGIYAPNAPFALRKFSGNTFEGSGDTPTLNNTGNCETYKTLPGVTFGRRSYCGIYIDGSLAGDLTMPASSSGNVFKKLQTGIVCLQASAAIRGCRFEDIQQLPSILNPHRATAVAFIDRFGAHRLLYYGLGKDGQASISNCERGIFAQSEDPGTRVYVFQTKMEQVQNGIIAREISTGNFSLIHVQQNNITCNKSSRHLQQSAAAVEVADPNLMFTRLTIVQNKIKLDLPDAFSNVNIVIPERIPTGILIDAMHGQINGDAMAGGISGNEIDMTNGVQGIYGINLANIGVSNNDIYNSRQIDPNILDPLEGIRVEGGISNDISCNTVSNKTSTQSGMLGITPIGTPDFVLDGNTVYANWVGLAVGDNSGTSCTIHANDMVRNDAFVNSFPDFGLLYRNAITGPQELQGNQWVGSFVGGARFSAFAGNVSYCASLYTVTTGANVNNAQNPIIQGTGEPCGDWFTTEDGFENADGCGTGGGGTDPTALKNDADVLLAGGGANLLDPGMRWSVEANLYRKFSEQPQAVGGDATISGFMSANANAAVGRAYQVRRGVAGVRRSSPSLLATAAQLEDQLGAARDQLETVLSTVPFDAAAYATQLALISSLEQQWQQNNTQLLAADAAAANGLLSQNASLACTGTPCSLEAQLNALYLETQVHAPRPLTSNEAQTVADIAQLCAKDAGPVVYLARAWHYILSGNRVTSACGVLQGLQAPEDRERRAEPGTGFILQPNPASGWVTIVLPEDFGAGTLIVRDLQGRVAQSLILPEGTPRAGIQTGTLPNGTYLVTLASSTGGFRATSKLVVIH